jgi:hypothetical protein
MTPDVEEFVRARLAAARLPAAPSDLRQFVEELAIREPMRRARFWGDGRLLVAVALVLLVAAIIGVSLVGTSRVPSVATTAPAGYRQFSGPGINFLYPNAWASQQIPEAFVDSWSHRYIGYITKGPPECSLLPTPLATGADAATCDPDGQTPGSLVLQVSEYTHPVPGESSYDRPVTFTANPPYEMSLGDWYVTDPGGGIYRLSFSAPYGELDGHRDQILALIHSIALSAWQRPAMPSVDGHMEITIPYGSVTYADAWTTYKFMPWYASMIGSGPDLLISSKPLAPCIPAGSCHLADPEGAIVILVSAETSAFGPDWATADTHIGGRPAISRDPYVNNGIQNLGWTVQANATGSEAIDIDVAMPAGSDPALQHHLDEILAGIQLPDAAPTSAP